MCAYWTDGGMNDGEGFPVGVWVAEVELYEAKEMTDLLTPTDYGEIVAVVGLIWAAVRLFAIGHRGIGTLISTGALLLLVGTALPGGWKEDSGWRVVEAKAWMLSGGHLLVVWGLGCLIVLLERRRRRVNGLS